MKASEAIGIRRKQPTVPFTYFVQTEGQSRAIKIGTTGSPLRKLKDLQEGSPDRLKIVGFVRAYSVFEEILHRAFRNERFRADWFLPDSKLLDIIRRLREREIGKLLTAAEFDELCAEAIRSELIAAAEYRAAERIFRRQRMGAA